METPQHMLRSDYLTGIVLELINWIWEGGNKTYWVRKSVEYVTGIDLVGSLIMFSKNV